jgi:hypothetical protein
MNWKIILQLSIFGLIMAFGTVSLIPQNIEPAFWLIIFVFCAYVIAKVCTRKYFLHGFLLSLVNCIWLTAVHAIYYKNYTAHHPVNASMGTDMLPASFITHPRLAMIIVAPLIGIMFGIILGLFSFVAAKIVNKKKAY